MCTLTVSYMCTLMMLCLQSNEDGDNSKQEYLVHFLYKYMSRYVCGCLCVLRYTYVYTHIFPDMCCGCVYMFACVYLYVCVHACVCLLACVGVCVSVCVCVCVCVFVCVLCVCVVCVCVCVCVCLCVCVCVLTQQMLRRCSFLYRSMHVPQIPYQVVLSEVPYAPPPSHDSVLCTNLCTPPNGPLCKVTLYFYVAANLTLLTF